MNYSLRSVGLLLVASLCVASPAFSQSKKVPDVYAAWSQIIGTTDDGQASDLQLPKVEMRFIVDIATKCDMFLALPDNVASRPHAVPTEWASDPLNVRVCRALLPDTWVRVQLYHKGSMLKVKLTSKVNFGSDYGDLDPNSKAWINGASDGKLANVAGPAWIGQNSDLKLVTLGDTGCKGRDNSYDGSRQFQLCDNDPAHDKWPFALIAQQASQPGANGKLPDLVIHVGDYRYFFEDKGPPDSWALWQKDFFPAAQPLLLAAPWVFARGNHEGCLEANDPYGVGYFQFFGTDANKDCASVPQDKPYMAPWYFDIKAAGASNDLAHRFVVLDTNAYNGTDHQGNDIGFQSEPAIANFTKAIKMSSNVSWSSWWVKHTPTVQLIYYSQGGKPHYGDKSFRQALMAATGDATAAADRFCSFTSGATCRPSQILLGHEHLYQDVVFGDAKKYFYPRQFIVGHGGVDNDGDGAKYGTTTTCENKNFPIGADGAGVTGTATTRAMHGLVIWDRSKTIANEEPSGWKPEYLWAGSQNLSPTLPPSSLSSCPG